MKKWSLALSFLALIVLAACGASIEDYTLENTEITLSVNETVTFASLLNDVPENLSVTTTNEAIVDINEDSLVALKSGFATIVFSIEEGTIGYLEVVVPNEATDEQETEDTSDNTEEQDDTTEEQDNTNDDSEETSDNSEELSVSDIWDGTYENDDVVDFEGVVVALTDRGYILQDTVLTDLISIFDDENTPSIGDLVLIEGVYTIAYRMTSIRELTNYNVKSSNNTLNLSTDNALTIDWANYNGRDDLETGQLVKFENFFARFSATQSSAYLRLGDDVESVDSQQFDEDYHIGLQIGANNLNLGDITDLFDAAIGDVPFDYDGVTLYAMIYDSSSSYDKFIVLDDAHIIGLDNVTDTDESDVVEETPDDTEESEDTTEEQDDTEDPEDTEESSNNDNTENDDTYQSITALHQNASDDDVIQITGVVSSIYDQGFFIEDTDGIQLNIYNPSGDQPAIGENVSVSGEYSNYYTNFQLGGDVSYEVNSSNNQVSNTVLNLDLSDLGDSFDLEDKNNHGKLIRITGLLTEKTSGSYTDLYITDEDSDSEVMIYYRSDGDSLDYLEQYLDEVITVTVRYYTNHSDDGIMVTYLQSEGNLEN